MRFSRHDVLLIIYTSQHCLSAHALPPATPPPQTITAPLKNVNTSTDALIGGNCHGSLWCSLYDGEFIRTAYHLVTTGYPPPTTPSPGWNAGPMNDTAFYAQGAHAVCLPITSSFSQAGFCVFAQHLRGRGSDEPGVTGQMVKSALGRLVEMGCRMCGSVGNGEEGWVTANYVRGPVCGGVCPEARYEVVVPAAVERSPFG
ncbi:MAG: hypothetical protein Q9208_005356 [Pyrenodesmia sp. 3 TL-2023]